MSYPIIDKSELVGDAGIGGKAKNLFRLTDIGINVPPFVVIPQEVLSGSLTNELLSSDHKTIATFIQHISIPQQILDDIASHFPDNGFVAVRSSATDEDGSGASFAGQFESHLFVRKNEIAEKIKLVWASLFSDRVAAYRESQNVGANYGMAVIIQAMVAADAAGVAFGINPITADTTEKMINAVYGLGEGLVSGELNADLFTLKDGVIRAELADKTHQFVLDTQNGKGLKQVDVDESKWHLAALSDKHIKAIAGVLDDLYEEYRTPQDIEFAVKGDELFLLQARPITTGLRITGSTDDHTVWDNSNIIESYPGVTTPLTFSFISQSYQGAYKLFCSYMGISDDVISQNQNVFANTLGLINGRVYYNLKSWYHMLAMAPGYSINARFMESMMGVKERFDVPESYRLSKGKAFFRIVKMLVKMYVRYLALDKKKKEFVDLLDSTIAEYKKIDFKNKTASELLKLYTNFESVLLNEWKAPLINDFFAMIGYGMLQKTCQKYQISANPNIHNDLLCGSSDIISTQPIHRCVALATMISKDDELKQLFILENEVVIWKKLSDNQTEKYKAVKQEVDRYIADFGERCIGELKLETISYTQDPAKFIKVLKAYVDTGITVESTSGKIEEEIRRKAEQEIDTSLKGKWYKKWRLKRALKMARQLVSSRENLRYERTRAFGMVREMFSAIGHQFYLNAVLDDPRDVFYLTKQEIASYIEGTSVTQNLKELVKLRRTEFDGYKKQEAPSERFATKGAVYYGNNFYDNSKVDKGSGVLKGIGCCPGVVRAKVRVISDPSQVSSLNGDILITSSTDPGWVVLFPSASGIITERGSVLSHSAIVSREMGKPCIVGVSGLLKTLKTGDEIQMDGSTGAITITKSAD